MDPRNPVAWFVLALVALRYVWKPVIGGLILALALIGLGYMLGRYV